MARPEKKVSQETKVDICALNATKNMGAKKISKLEKFRRIGYNKIGRIIKKDCPGILASANGSDALTNGAAPSGVLISPPVSGELNQTGTGSSSNQWKLKDAESMLSSDFSSEAPDSDPDDYDLDPYLGGYSPIQPIQTSMLNPTDFLKGLVNGLNTTFNSRMHSWMADWADRVTRPLFPNLFPPNPQKTDLEKMMERVEEDVEKRESKAPIDLELNDEESSGNCSCALGEQNSVSVETSDQKVSTIGTESDVTGNEMHGMGIDASKHSSNVKVASDAGSVTAPEIGQTTKRVKEWKRLTSESSSGNRVTLPFDPASPPVTPDTPGVNIQPDTPPKPPSPSTVEHPTLSEGKSESSKEEDSNKSESEERQAADNKQNSEGVGVVKEQFPLIGGEGPVIVGNDSAPPLQTVDHADSGQQPPFTSGRSEPQQPPLTAPNPPTDNQQIDNGRGEDKCDLLGQVVKTETNEQSFDWSDLIVPGILIGLATALIAGVVNSFNNQNKQPETRTEVRELPNPRLNVKEKTKPAPPSLYSIQPQGDTATTRIF